MHKKSVGGLAALAGLIVFVVFNILTFAIAGFSGHTGAFWLAYVFTVVAFAVAAIECVLASGRNTASGDWLFGYPIYRHCVLYVGLAVVIGAVFMGLSGQASWKLVLVVELLLLAAHLLLSISCFAAKRTIENVRTNVKAATASMKLLRADAESAVARMSDAESAALMRKLAEDIRFSDPMSSPALEGLERQIGESISAAVACAAQRNDAGARSCIEQAQKLLAERNRKCMLLK